MTMKRMLSATFGLAALGVMLVGCSTTSSSSWLDSGNMYYRNSEYVSAADAFSEAIAKNPRSAAAWNNRAAARLRLGEISGAVADYNKAIELAPNDAEIYYNRATVYAMLGQPAAGQADWSRAIALEPDPWAKMAMRRTAGLDPTPVVAVGPATVATQPAVAPVTPPGMGPATVPPPRTPVPVTANPPVAPAPPPVVMVAPPTSQPQPAASVQALDARALASRAITRELDGDHTGAMQDLTTAVQLEPDASRRASLANLIRLLDTSR